jgi:hypothetical protein
MNIKLTAAASTGVARTWKKAVTNWDQVVMGSRPQLSPGARILTMVVKKLSPERLEEKPVKKIPMSQKTWPDPYPGEAVETSLKGA